MTLSDVRETKVQCWKSLHVFSNFCFMHSYCFRFSTGISFLFSLVRFKFCTRCGGKGIEDILCIVLIAFLGSEIIEWMKSSIQ